MNYHKVYMNHVHSSSLLTQLATMWKSQTLCDAVIRTGSIITKAHRVVLVAACPMLQSMENATSGSHLEVRLASDIKQDSINTFLQYLYEGFMILTEDNCKDVEKIARLLQVDGVIKCCLDFIKCLNASSSMQFKYSFHDQTEFKHVRVSEMFKVHERQQKRQSEALRPSSPGSKRQRILRPSSPPQDVMQMGAGKTHDTERMTESYKSSASDPWDRVPRLGSQGASSQGASSQPGVIDIREDCLELIQTEPPKDSGGGRSQEPRKVQSSVSISVASQHNTNTDLRIINVDNDSSSKVPSSTHPSSSSTRGPITVSPLTMYHDSPASSSSSVDSTRVTSERHPVSGPPPKPPSDHERQIPPTINLTDFQPLTSDSFSQVKQRSSDSFSTSTPQRNPYPVSLSTAQRTALSSQSKSFAAGSASQASMSHSFTEGMSSTGQRSQQPSASGLGKSDNMEGVAIEKSIDISAKMKSDDTPSTSDMTPDISIVKVEAASEAEQAEVEGGLDMYVTAGGVSVTSQSQARPSEDDDMDPADFDLEEPPGDWSRDEQMSNEASNVSGDQSGSWYTGQYKGRKTGILYEESSSAPSKPPKKASHSYIVLDSPTSLSDNDKSCDPAIQGASLTSEQDLTQSIFPLSQVALESAEKLQELPFSLNQEDSIAVSQIYCNSLSCQNFAWKLAQYFYSSEELRDHNCFGKRGKQKLDTQKLKKIYDIVFMYYPAPHNDPEIMTRMWKGCVIAIDKGIRNTFGHYSYRTLVATRNRDTNI